MPRGTAPRHVRPALLGIVLLAVVQPVKVWECAIVCPQRTGRSLGLDVAAGEVEGILSRLLQNELLQLPESDK